ncbi:minor capsid protein [Streptococcus suis]|uniref:minor capsid protein n=1 Tax=Streptococcus suis TaxID=1307 RepID=UPI00237CFF46|nr:minor capsid protein [Streptococcus suis]MDE1692220.1 minor capsid protein [Streptococcus suis]
MNNLKYWEKRKAQRMVREMDKAEQVAKNLDEIYSLTSRRIASKIDQIFESYRRDHGLTEAEARRVLDNVKNLSDIRELKLALQNTTDSEEIRQLLILLDSAPYASRIERYEALQREVDNLSTQLYKAENGVSRSFYDDFIPDAYYHSIFDLQQQSGVAFAFNRIDPEEIRAIQQRPWLGANYSERIWGNTQTLANELQKQLAVSLLTGQSVRETAEAIEAQFGKGSQNARRLVRTETSHFHAEMEAKAYEEADVEYYRFLATLDLRTSSICREHDGKIYKVSERITGKNYPPLHPWCRSDTIASDDSEWLAKATRSARDPVTGKTIQVPGDMTYKDWYAKNVEQPKERELSGKEFGADLDYVRSEDYLNKLRKNPKTADIADSVARVSRQILQHRNGTPFEDYYLLEANTGKVVAISNKARKKKGVVYNDQVRYAFKNSSERSLVSIHNHPSGYPPSLSDLASLQQRSKNNSIRYGLTAGHDGSIYWYTRPNKRIPKIALSKYSHQIEKFKKMGYNEAVAQEKTLEMFSNLFEFEFGRID